jgi:hypothetical protein
VPSRVTRCILTLVATASFTCEFAIAGNGEILDVKMNPAVGKYCHVVRFSQGWKIQPFDDLGQRLTIDLTVSDYEFRVDGLLDTRFLVGAFHPGIEHRYEAANYYRVNLSDPAAPALPASVQNWKAGTIVPLARKFQAFGTLANDQPLVFNGIQFNKSGRWWYDVSVSRLSPDSAWLVLQSITDDGTSKLTLRSLSKVFMDVFHADTGEKVLTIEGTYSGYGDDPGGTLAKTAWLTERYFIVPLGEHRERCLVCEFGTQGRAPGAKP